MNRFSRASPNVSFNHLSELEEAVTEKTAAIMLEPIQGEGGVHAFPAIISKRFATCARKKIFC